MRKLVAVAAVLTSIVAVSWSVSAFAASQTPGSVLEARVGDEIRLVDAPIGCRVFRMRQLGGRVVVDCRKAGPLRGTYGTLLSAREAVLVEFESRGRAKQVHVAVHDGAARRCR